MSFTEGSGGSSSPESVALGEILSFFGNVADHAAGRAIEDGERIAALAVGMARLAGLDSSDCDALYFAARLRNAGVLGNEAFAKGDPLSERAAMTARWDVPPQGARICEKIGALPRAVCDIVRWQAEGWDGTGFPDQSAMVRNSHHRTVAASLPRHMLHRATPMRRSQQYPLKAVARSGLIRRARSSCGSTRSAAGSNRWRCRTMRSRPDRARPSRS